MANPTMVKFGYPETRIAETAHWSVQLRPNQPTLGSLMLISTEEARAFSALSPQAFADLGEVVSGVERVLASFVGFERINYLMLMMVDPDVHFHVIPRYAGERALDGRRFPDAGWPGQPRLDEATALSPDMARAIRASLAALWSRGRP